MTPYCTEIKVRFGDEDRAGVVYFPRYFDFFHRAFEDFFEDRGHPYRDVIEGERLGWPVVRAEGEFRAPLSLGDVLQLELVLDHLGDRAATFRYRGRRKADQEMVVEGSTTVVCVHLGTFEARPIPAVYRDLFEAVREESAS